jgi:hypothetical protein
VIQPKTQISGKSMTSEQKARCETMRQVAKEELDQLDKELSE